MNINKVRRAPVTIQLDDGKERVIKYTLNSFALMEEQYGSVELAIKAMEEGSIKAVRFMLWAGLVSSDEALTEQYVGNHIDILDLEEIVGKMNSTMSSDLPDNDAAVPNG